MKKLLLAGVCGLTLCGNAWAQTIRVVASCDTITIAGPSGQLFQDTSGKLCTGTTSTPLAVTPVTATAAAVSNQVLKATSGTFFGAQVNTTSAAEWVMLFNLTALPSNGAVTPVAVWQVPVNSTLSISENPGFTMSTGIVLGCSTTGPDTLTASALCKFASGAVQ